MERRRSVEGPLPPSTIRRDGRLCAGGGRFYPAHGLIRLGPGAGRLVKDHEKGHYLWHVRMSRPQRQRFYELLQPHLVDVDLLAPFPGATYPWVEEAWAEGYARLKQDHRQLPPSFRRALQALLREPRRSTPPRNPGHGPQEVARRRVVRGRTRA